MAECQQCHGKSEVWLCRRCQEDLRELLIGLATGQDLGNGRRRAGFLEFLEDAALGRTRLGESARRSTDRTSPMPVNLTASTLLDDVTGTLAHWVSVVNTNAEMLAVPGREGE